MTGPSVDGGADSLRARGDRRSAARLRWVARVGLAGSLALNTYVSLSGPVALWWEKESSTDTSTLPQPVQDVLSARPSTSQADVHLVLWFVAGLLAVLATRAGRTRWIVLAALVAYGGLLEVAQGWTGTRSPQWGDFLGDAMGVVAAGVLGSLLHRLVVRRRMRSAAGTTKPSQTTSSGCPS